ncbi:MAG: hypothetical protein MJ025_04615 [Victivallaceae bacterium]|nr:hypothetical protein [Victivallaceae bacterium]
MKISSCFTVLLMGCAISAFAADAHVASPAPQSGAAAAAENPAVPAAAKSGFNQTEMFKAAMKELVSEHVKEEKKAAPTEMTLSSNSLSIDVNERRLVHMPFPVSSVRAFSGNVKATLRGGCDVEFFGVSEGDCVVEMRAKHVVKRISVTVVSAAVRNHRLLTEALSDVPEVSVELTGGGVVLEGEINGVQQWENFRRIVANYSDQCFDYVVFRPRQQLIDEFRKAISDLGLKVTDDSFTDELGTVAVRLKGNVLHVNGVLRNSTETARIDEIIATRKWLDPRWNNNSLSVSKGLRISDAQIEVNIVFVGIAMNKLEELGNANADGTILNWNVLAWFRAMRGATSELTDQMGRIGQGSGGGAIALDSNLKGTLKMFGNNGITDFRDAGHLVLTNESSQFAEYENGGRRSARVVGRDVADLKDIDYGFKYKVKGHLINGNRVVLDVDFEKSLAPEVQDGDYLQKRTKIKSSLVCPLGKTTMLAGERELRQTNNGPSGYAFLRHIPIINWFTAVQQDTAEDTQMVMLVYPQIPGSAPDLTSIPSAESAAVEKRAADKVESDAGLMREKDERPWYKKMFTW